METATTDPARYAQIDRIPWYSSDMLSQKRVVLVGIGALGSWVLPHLALNGIGLLLVDFDRVEIDNLPRSPLFNAEDVGEFKCVAAA